MTPRFYSVTIKPTEFEVMRDTLWKRRDRVARGYAKALEVDTNNPQLVGIVNELTAIDSLIEKFGLHYPKKE